MSSRGWSKGTAYKKFLRINSTNRLLPSDPDSNFSINLGTNLQQVAKISVLQCQFTNAFYNVFATSAKYNNEFFFQYYDGTYHTSKVVVPPGYYSTYTLLNYIATQISTISGGTAVLTSSLNSISNIVSMYVTYTAPTTAVTVFRTTSGPSQGRQDNWPFGLLGYTENTIAIDNSTNPSVAQNFPSLNNPSKVYVTSSALAPSNSLDEDGKTSNILLPIDITVPFQGLQTWECKIDEQFEVNYGRARNLGQVDIQLVDHDGDVLDLHGTVFNIDLQVFINQF
jgi:hypothetical protein